MCFLTFFLIFFTTAKNEEETGQISIGGVREALEKNDGKEVNITHIKLYLKQFADNQIKAEESLLKDLRDTKQKMLAFLQSDLPSLNRDNIKAIKYQQDIMFKLTQIKFYLKTLTKKYVDDASIQTAYKREVRKLQVELHKLKKKERRLRMAA